eukprot:44650-Chlamydomonas_euryale.AAC.2
MPPHCILLTRGAPSACGAGAQPEWLDAWLLTLVPHLEALAPESCSSSSQAAWAGGAGSSGSSGSSSNSGTASLLCSLCAAEAFLAALARLGFQPDAAWGARTQRVLVCIIDGIEAGSAHEAMAVPSSGSNVRGGNGGGAGGAEDGAVARGGGTAALADAGVAVLEAAALMQLAPSPSALCSAVLRLLARDGACTRAALDVGRGGGEGGNAASPQVGRRMGGKVGKRMSWVPAGTGGMLGKLLLKGGKRVKRGKGKRDLNMQQHATAMVTAGGGADKRATSVPVGEGLQDCCHERGGGGRASSALVRKVATGRCMLCGGRVNKGAVGVCRQFSTCASIASELA